MYLRASFFCLYSACNFGIIEVSGRKKCICISWSFALNLVISRTKYMYVVTSRLSSLLHETYIHVHILRKLCQYFVNRVSLFDDGLSFAKYRHIKFYEFQITAYFGEITQYYFSLWHFYASECTNTGQAWNVNVMFSRYMQQLNSHLTVAWLARFMRFSVTAHSNWIIYISSVFYFTLLYFHILTEETFIKYTWQQSVSKNYLVFTIYKTSR